MKGPIQLSLIFKQDNLNPEQKQKKKCFTITYVDVMFCDTYLTHLFTYKNKIRKIIKLYLTILR